LPIEEWMSWVDPKTAEPDFHMPSSLGWFEVVKLTVTTYGFTGDSCTVTLF
jgi:hypothetical protein